MRSRTAEVRSGRSDPDAPCPNADGRRRPASHGPCMRMASGSAAGRDRRLSLRQLMARPDVGDVVRPPCGRRERRFRMRRLIRLPHRGRCGGRPSLLRLYGAVQIVRRDDGLSGPGDAAAQQLIRGNGHTASNLSMESGRTAAGSPAARPKASLCAQTGPLRRRKIGEIFDFEGNGIEKMENILYNGPRHCLK